mmetsp:Transcript_83092/g.164832  ORF Transcript_83092/g.164832 Transcript_83092/m.164832 type:complete len:318 (+) Transcript_83092:93-1046(+)
MEDNIAPRTTALLQGSGGANAQHGFCGKRICPVFFALALLLALLPALVVSVTGNVLNLVTCGCAKKCCGNVLQQTVIVTFALGSRIAMGLCCWIRIRPGTSFQTVYNAGETGRPCLFVANHTSFFDILVIMSIIPISKVRKARMFVSHKLFKTPVLGTIVRAMGHYSVPFNNTDDQQKRQLQADTMRREMARFEESIASGGWGSWFPEGRVNFDDNHTVNQFKKGGFVPAVRLDVELWCCSFCGNAVSWPARAGFGGRPACIGVELERLCESTHDFLANKGLERSNIEASSMFLANVSQEFVQARLNKLIEEGFVGH